MDQSSIELQRDVESYIAIELLEYYEKYPDRANWRRDGSLSGWTELDLYDQDYYFTYNHRWRVVLPAAFSCLERG